MARNERIVYNAQATGTLNINGAVADTITGGPTLLMSKVTGGTLSALVTVDAETSTLTMAAVWQVSNDATTWVNALVENAAAEVVLATGTAGADAAVTRVITAPNTVYGWRYARLSIRNGVATGTTNDTYSIGYCYENDDLAV